RHPDARGRSPERLYVATVVTDALISARASLEPASDVADGVTPPRGTRVAHVANDRRFGAVPPRKDTQSSSMTERTMSIRETLISGPLGFGAAPLGNMFRNIPEEEALATVQAAWQHGTRYFDTAPFYGAGLSEIRLGKALARHRRDDYVLSTKV